MISALSGLRAVGTTAEVTRPSATPAAGGGDFGKVLADVASNTVDSLKAGESAAISGISGARSVQSVVEAMLNADQALQTAVAVRDKLVSAYQEISRMNI